MLYFCLSREYLLKCIYREVFECYYSVTYIADKNIGVIIGGKAQVPSLKSAEFKNIS